MAKWNPKIYEQKWQDKWEVEKTYKTDLDSEKPKSYVLDMFPYPSGSGLHMGHWRGYTLSDVVARIEKMKGKEVLHPMGFDAFGLPAENYAIKTGIHPEQSTSSAIKHFKKQLGEIGAMYDWDMELATYDESYYRWTQWLFVQMYEKGLAYRKEAPVNWCPSCQTVLANEQVVDGECERCDTEVSKKNLTQWFFKITDYADQLVDDLDDLQWPDRVKAMQKNWIGRSYGAEVDFDLVETVAGIENIKIYTTRVDTLFGCTFVVVAPESPILSQLKNSIENWAEVEIYIREASQKTEIDRTRMDKEKTGVQLKGVSVVNPINGKEIPVWVADFALAHYGTGAVMCVPAHDQRDWDFARKYNIEIKSVVKGGEIDEIQIKKGILFDSGDFTGMTSEEALENMPIYLKKINKGKKTKNYKLRDWLISRQRYWGCPIPIVYCPSCGIVPEKAENLPVKLPKDIENWQPKGGKSPLASVESFVRTTCPSCGGRAERETDTMDTFVDSSWYFLRYPSSSNDDKVFSKEIMNKWLPVDFYVGGIEHAVLHLLYARFFTKAIADMGLISFREPFTRLFNQGMITLNGVKMSKSKGNVVSPDDIVTKYGTDCLRAYELFIGPPEQNAEWSQSGIEGVYRFLGRFWVLADMLVDVSSATTIQKVHQTIAKIHSDIDKLQLNTVVASLMECTNTIYKEGGIGKLELEMLIKAIAPIAPHLAEEMWQGKLGYHNQSIFTQRLPEYDPSLAVDDQIELVVQINGKVRAKLIAMADISQEDAFAQARTDTKVAGYLAKGEVIKEIWVPNKIIGFVIK